MKISHDRFESAVGEFSNRVGFVGLYMPDGWFGGRPMENQHRLTFAAARRNRLLIELDDRLLLSFVGSDTTAVIQRSTLARVDGTLTLTISGFKQCLFEWLEVGSDRPHVDTYTSGEVKLVGAM